MRKKYKATAALLVSVAGFAGTYPYAGSFAGGLVNSGFLAAMIGGLADWFAVTALFHKPLGISYRTQILVRNRERLMQALVDFASKDLLNVDNIMKIVREYDTARMLVHYLDEYGGRGKLKLVINQFVDAVLQEMDTKKIGRELAGVVDAGLRKLDMAELFLQVMKESVGPKYSDRAAVFFLDAAGMLLREANVQQLLRQNIGEIKAKYEGSSTGRSLMLEICDLSDERLTEIVTQEMLKYMEKLKNPEHPSHNDMRQWLLSQIEQLGNNSAYHTAVAGWKQAIIENKIDIAQMIADYLEEQVKKGRQDILASEKGINAFLDATIDELAVNKELQQRLDAAIKDALEKFIRSQHGMIIQLIRDRLASFSDAAMVEFVETRVADDMQMIRINGSLVGSLVGILLYLVTFLAERMWG